MDPGPVGVPTENELAERVYQRNALVEVYSRPECGACPLAHYNIKNISDSIDQVIYFSQYTEGPFLNEYTEHCIDQVPRTVFTPLFTIQRSGNEDGVLYYTSDRFLEMINGIRYQGDADVGLEISTSATNGQAEVEVKVYKNDNIDLESVRLNLILVKNERSGHGPGYDQRNYGHDDPDHPYYQEGEYITGFKHSRVITQVISDFEGDEIEFSNYKATKTYNIDISSLPGELSGFTLVAFVTDGNSTFADVLNARDCALDGQAEAQVR